MASCSHGGRQKYSIFLLELLFHYSNFPLKYLSKEALNHQRQKKRLMNLSTTVFHMYLSKLNLSTCIYTYRKVVVSNIFSDFQKAYEAEISCLCTVTFGQKDPKLNSRPVYCFRLCGSKQKYLKFLPIY